MADVLAQEILRNHIEQMSRDIERVADGQDTINFQLYSDRALISVSEAAMLTFCHEPSLLELAGPVVVVGDIHGHILDLYRIFTKYDLPPATKYLFLGDIVDRGPFGIESLFLILSLKILYPKHINVIRGNHEFRSMTARCGFMEEVEEMYGKGTRVFDSIINCFKYLPLAAKIGEILCVHGGMDPSLHKISQIKEFLRPISEYNQNVIEGLLWSDPSNKTMDGFIGSHRGNGYEFGENVVTEFLKNNNLKHIIRGHECVCGIKTTFSGKIITVFSASNYLRDNNNDSGVVLIDEKSNCYPVQLPMIPFLARNMVKFLPIAKVKESLTGEGLAKTKMHQALSQYKLSSISSSNTIFQSQALLVKKMRKRMNSNPLIRVHTIESHESSHFPSLLFNDG